MALDAFGPAVDVQAGGADLRFPHHAYQAAMAEALTGVTPFARARLQAAVVTIGGAKMAKSAGNLVLVKHGNGWISAYAHCDELLVKKGDPVYRGKVIAKVGATGGVSEPQLHFELRQGKRPVDPRGYLGAAPDA